MSGSQGGGTLGVSTSKLTMEEGVRWPILSKMRVESLGELTAFHKLVSVPDAIGICNTSIASSCNNAPDSLAFRPVLVSSSPFPVARDEEEADDEEDEVDPEPSSFFWSFCSTWREDDEVEAEETEEEEVEIGC